MRVVPLASKRPDSTPDRKGLGQDTHTGRKDRDVGAVVEAPRTFSDADDDRGPLAEYER